MSLVFKKRHKKNPPYPPKAEKEGVVILS